MAGKVQFTIGEMNMVMAVLQADIIQTGKILEYLQENTESWLAADSRKNQLCTLRDKLTGIITSGPLEEKVRFDFTRKG